MTETGLLLHGLALSGPSYKVALMLALAGVPYDYRHVDLRGGAHKTPDYLAINRFGQVPALSEGDLHLCQSDAILIYLAEKFDKFDGANTALKLKVREWLFWQADRLAPGIFRSRAARLGFQQLDPAVVDYFKTVGEAGLAVLDAHCAEGWLVGSHLTIADIACYVVVSYAPDGGFDLAAYPNIQTWMKMVESQPGFQPAFDLMPMPAA